MKYSIITAPHNQGSLKIVCVKNIVYALHVKWIKHLSLNLGLSWSQVVWLVITSAIPADLIEGMTFILESLLSNLDPFYAIILCSYYMINKLFL